MSIKDIKADLKIVFKNLSKTVKGLNQSEYKTGFYDIKTVNMLPINETIMTLHRTMKFLDLQEDQIKSMKNCSNCNNNQKGYCVAQSFHIDTDSYNEVCGAWEINNDGN